MAKYLVTGAMVQVQTATTDGTPVLIYRYRGDVVELGKADAQHLSDVGLVEKFGDVDSDVNVNPAPGWVGVTPEQPTGGRPADDADVELWVAYAVGRGLAESDARLADREDLVAMYSGTPVQPVTPEPVAPAPADPVKPAPKPAAPTVKPTAK